ncbi:MAG: ATPase [Bacillota bacterium]|nr:ATPase [Bacillota bacterium]
MNVIDLLQMLEEEIENSSTIPLTRKKIVDKEAALDIISRIRINMPDDIKQAQMLNLERQRIIRDAHEEAEAIVREAKRRAEQLLEEHEITQHAYEKAQEIMGDAQKNAKEIKTGAKAYADDVLRELERYLNDNLKMLAKNRAEMGKK